MNFAAMWLKLKSLAKLRVFVASLFLGTSLIFLGACSPTIQTTECSWSEPIRFSQETKQWLSSLEWPPPAYADFNKVGDHNELWDRYCN